MADPTKDRPGVGTEAADTSLAGDGNILRRGSDTVRYTSPRANIYTGSLQHRIIPGDAFDLADVSVVIRGVDPTTFDRPIAVAGATVTITGVLADDALLRIGAVERGRP